MEKANVYIPTHHAGIDLFINYSFEVYDDCFYKEIISLDVTLKGEKVVATVPVEQMNRKVQDALAELISELHDEQNAAA
jgi:hypothetical protein